MNVLHTPAHSGPAAAVRLIGIGASGRRFVQHFHSHIDTPLHTPLADLLQQKPNYIEIDSGEALHVVEQVDLENACILCLAFGFDMTSAEIEAAMLLVWRVWGRDAHAIGVVLGANNHRLPNNGLMLGMLCDSIDARIDIEQPTNAAELAPLQWFYMGLQRSVLEGLSILGPAWDHSDVVEVLDLGQVQVTLLTQPLGDLAQLDAAMAAVLEDLSDCGIWIEQALGAVLVLWVPSEYQLTLRAVRSLGRSLSEALGEGASHLTIRLPSRPAGGDQTAHLTLAVSLPRATTAGR